MNKIPNFDMLLIELLIVLWLLLMCKEIMLETNKYHLTFSVVRKMLHRFVYLSIANDCV